MDKILKSLLSMQMLMFAASIIIAVGSSYILVDRVLVPRAMSRYGITESTAAVREANGGREERGEKTGTPKKPKKGSGTKSGPVSYNLPSIVVNINKTEGRRFLKTGITLEVDDAAVLKELETAGPKVTNLLIETLSAYGIDDLTEPSGKERIREELKDRFNLLLETGDVLAVYFTEFVIQ